MLLWLAGNGLFPDLSKLSFRDTAKPQQIVTKINHIYLSVVVRLLIASEIINMVKGVLNPGGIWLIAVKILCLGKIDSTTREYII